MSWDIKDIGKWSWRDHPPGAVIKDPGNSRQFKTGGWRSRRPVRNDERCSHCLVCFMFCPDSSIVVEDGKVAAFNLDFCKGCGICAAECRRSAIEMVDEVSIKKPDDTG